MAAKFTSAAEAELACGVCFQFFVKPHEPKNLPKCLHILCQICLQKMTEGGLRTVKCPLCNKISPLPEEGVDGLKTSLALRNLAERHPSGIEQYKEYLQSQLQCEQEKTADNVAKLKDLIKQKKDAIQVEEQAVMMKAQELIKQLQNISGLDQLQEQLSKLETGMKHIETSQSKLETMTNEEFHTRSDAITNQIEKLKIDGYGIEKITTASCVGKFIANIHDTQLGRIVKPRKLELVHEFGEFEWACDVASNTNGVLAVCDNGSKPQQVSVFQKNSTGYKLQGKFPVHSLSGEGSLEIAISEEGKYLVTRCAAGFDVYSSDGKFLNTESVIDEQLQVHKIVLSGSICGTKGGKILVGSLVKEESGEAGKGIVTVYDKGGSVMKAVHIDVELNQITGINGTHVAVCSSDSKVYVYDLQTGKETLNIDVQMVQCICYDEQSDCLLIGRMTKTDENGGVVRGSGVIDQYCRVSGKLVACLGHGLHWPFGMTIIEDNVLAVADVSTVKLCKME